MRLAGALLRAVWAEERDISDAATLAAIASERGLDAEALAAAASSPDVAAHYDALTQEAIERQIFGLSIYCGSSYRVAIDDGKIISATTSGYIGRMPIHPALMKFAGALLFSNTWETLARERKDVARLEGIEFHPQSVTLVIPP